MKKFKSLSLIFLVVFCIAIFAGCSLFESGFVIVDHWGFTPAQASGTDINLTIIKGSYLSFDFTIYNNISERTLLADSFDVVIVCNDVEESAEEIMFDNFQKSLSFGEKTKANIKLKALCKSTISGSAKIIIKYSGTTICQYLIS